MKLDESFKSEVFDIEEICFNKTNNNSIKFFDLYSIWAI